MLRKLLPALLLALLGASAQTPTYFAAGPNDSPRIATLRQKLHAGNPHALETFWAAIHKSGAPLIEPASGTTGFSLVTFLWKGNPQTQNVVIFDGVAAFDAKDRMLHLGSTDVWYKTYRVRNDARFAYNISPNDSLQSINEIKGDDAMRKRLAMLQVDPLNPHRCPTTFGAYGTDSSYVELPNAPPLVWSSPTSRIRRGSVQVTQIHSALLKSEKKLWVYTPPGFTKTHPRYPLLVIFDGDRNVSWIPKILDILITRRKIPPMVAIMTDGSIPSVRRDDLACNRNFTGFLAKELVPWSRRNFDTTLDPANTTVAGSSFGGLASVFAGIEHPEVFGNVVSLSGSFWWKPDGDKQPEWLTHFVSDSPKKPLRFYLEVGLMESYPMQIATNHHMRDTLLAKGYPVGFFEYDGGHAYLNWSNGMVRALEYLSAR